MAQTLEQLITRMSRTADPDYAQAARRYQSLYDQKRLSARQSYEAADAALQRQLTGLRADYADQRRRSAQDTAAAYAQADRQALSRGMQRSSYNAATLGNISLSGAADQRRIDEAENRQTQDVAQQRTQLTRQLHQQLQQYDADQQSDALAYADELRREARQYQLQWQQQRMDYAMWKAEFDAKYNR